MLRDWGMTDKVKAAEDFLRTLEDSDFTMGVMLDRIDAQVLYVIQNYSDLISRVKSKIDIDEKEIVTCAMIIGYLLKGHIDRYELEEQLLKNNI